MGTVVDAEACADKDSEESEAAKVCASDPVVYQLVRVEGDGRLVPATDDEVMEVEHLLEEEKSKLCAVEATIHIEGCFPSEGPSSKESDLEGFLHPENTEADSRESNARLEVMLQKLKQEERLQLSDESLNHSSKYLDMDGQASGFLNNSQACSDKLQPENASMESVPNSVAINGSQSAQLESAETCLGSANETVRSRSTVTETCSSSKPDFSILNGEICLDNLSIRELQEAFRATFGRQTTVKDKLWLKRRIAMGLTNSCDIPTTTFVIKDYKIVHKDVQDEVPSRLLRPTVEVGSLSTDQVSDPKSDDRQNALTGSTHYSEDQQLSGKRPRQPNLEDYLQNENLAMEQCAAKRMRKPTRRYIEELSEFETRDCTARLFSCVKSSGNGHSSPKSRARPLRDNGSRHRTFLTRQDSLGGLGIQVPYVSRVRRGRPRKNFMALMDYHPSDVASNLVKTTLGMSTLQQDGENKGKIRKARALPLRIQETKFVEVDRGKSGAEPLTRGKRDLEHEKLDAVSENSDDNADTQPSLKGGGRRKHHRAWTLCEVLKLVEGVAKFGAGRWSEIRRLAFASYAYRTSVDLKDKWRNLLRASMAQDPPEKASKNSRKHASIPIPTPILSRVRELAEMQSQTGIEFAPSKFASHGGRVVQGKGTGFL